MSETVDTKEVIKEIDHFLHSPTDENMGKIKHFFTSNEDSVVYALNSARDNKNVTRFGEIFHSPAHADLLCEAFPLDYNRLGSRQKQKEKNNEKSLAVFQRLKISDTVSLEDVKFDYDPVNMSKSQNSLILWGMSDAVYRKLTAVHKGDKDKNYSHAYQALYKDYWTQACKGSTVLPEVEQYLLDLTSKINAIKTLETNKANTDEACNALGAFIMDFKTKPHIASEIDNAYRLEFLIDSGYLKMDLKTMSFEKVAAKINSHAECGSGRRDALIQMITGYSLLVGREGINFNKKEDAEGPDPNTYVAIQYPMLSQLPKIVIEHKATDEKSLLNKAFVNGNQNKISTMKI